MKDKSFKATQNGFTINLDNGYKLAFEQNSDPNFFKEVFVGVIDGNGLWCQDLAVIRNAYERGSDPTVWENDTFEIFVYGDGQSEDYTHCHTIFLYRDEDDTCNTSHKYRYLGSNGAWNIIKYPSNCAIYSKCSRCGFTHPCYKQDPVIETKMLYDAENEYNFCPECGNPKGDNTELCRISSQE